MRRWSIPRIWPDSTVFIIGGGPSLHRHQIQLLQDNKAQGSYRVLGVNKAFRLGDWVDAIFFGDQKFYTYFRKEMIETYGGLKISTVAKCERDKNFKHIGKDRQKRHGISEKKDMVCWNKNSGCASINLAYHFGGKRIVLLGFDMKPMRDSEPMKEAQARAKRDPKFTPLSTHWHDGYPEFSRPGRNAKGEVPTKLPYHRYLGTIPTIAKDAKRLGIEIIDCSLEGALSAWPKRAVEEVIREEVEGGGCLLN